MRVVLMAICCSLSAGLMHGSSFVTCSAPGFTQTVENGMCSVPSSGMIFGAPVTTAIENGALVFRADTDLIALPTAGGAYPESASATWNDYFALPTSDSTDVLKLTVFGAGYGGPGSIQVGSINDTAAGGFGGPFCDEHYAGNPACTFTATESVADVPTVYLSGSDTFNFPDRCAGNCGIGLNANLDEYVQIQRFLADGVTPDPFTSLPGTTATPEPGTGGLFALGVCTGVAWLLKQLAGRRSRGEDFPPLW